MKGWLLDTNVVAELIYPHGSARVKSWAAAQAETKLYLSVLTIGEYQRGISNLPEDDERRVAYASTRDALARRFARRLLSVSNNVIIRWGAISGAVKQQTGHSPPVIDTLLAATALEHDICLVTRNIRDVRLSGAAVFNPWDNEPGKMPTLSRPGTRSV